MYFFVFSYLCPRLPTGGTLPPSIPSPSAQASRHPPDTPAPNDTQGRNNTPSLEPTPPQEAVPQLGYHCCLLGGTPSIPFHRPNDILFAVVQCQAGRQRPRWPGPNQVGKVRDNGSEGNENYHGRLAGGRLRSTVSQLPRPGRRVQEGAEGHKCMAVAFLPCRSLEGTHQYSSCSSDLRALLLSELLVPVVSGRSNPCHCLCV